MNPHAALTGLGEALAACAAGYGLAAVVAVRTRIRIRAPAPPLRECPPVSILKPLCGIESETYACLRSFCVLEYPQYQLVFGVADPDDPAIAVVARLKAEFPRCEIAVAVDPTQFGSNRKVGNLLNMLPLARHDVLVLSDSDVRVSADYLQRVASPLLGADVGIVTCSYRGVPRRNVWSLLGSQFINEWFMPSVRVAALGRSRCFAFGATIAITRPVLSRIGGFMAIANHLADDYRLGELTRRLGLRTVLSELVVETTVSDGSFGELVRHELRWLRTIRALQPLGYLFSLITFGVPVAAVGTLLAGGSAPAVGFSVLTCVARLALHAATRAKGFPAWQLLVLPFRDVLSLALWAWSFSTRRVQWRETIYRISPDGFAMAESNP